LPCEGQNYQPQQFRSFEGEIRAPYPVNLCTLSPAKESRTLILKRRTSRKIATNTLLLKLNSKFQDLLSREEGQGLVEYALLCALLAFGIISGMGAEAKGPDTAFSNIGGTLDTFAG